jgi:hypothetical protein
MSEPQLVPLSLEDVIVLMAHDLEADDLERASKWAALALSVNDPKESADA